MKDALKILEQAELNYSDIYATLTSLSGDIRVSIASSTQLNQSFLDTSQTSLESSDNKLTSSQSETITNESDTQLQQPHQPDIITIDSDDECHVNEISKNVREAVDTKEQLSHTTTVNTNNIPKDPTASTSFATTSYALNDFGKSPITPPIALRKPKRLAVTSLSKSKDTDCPVVKKSNNKKGCKQNKEKINALIKFIKQNKETENNSQSEIETTTQSVEQNTSPPHTQEPNFTLVPDSQPTEHAVSSITSQEIITDTPAHENYHNTLISVSAEHPHSSDEQLHESTDIKQCITTSEDSLTHDTENIPNNNELSDAALDAPNEILDNTSQSSTGDFIQNEPSEMQQIPLTNDEILNESINNEQHADQNLHEQSSPPHTQFEDVLNNPDDYAIISATEDNNEEDDEQTDANQVPEVLTTHRNGNTLWFIYPFVGVIKCTERGCNFTSAQTEWYKRASGLTSHLKKTHNIVCKYTEKWCVSCSSRITNLYHTSRHGCFAGLPITTPREEINEDMPFKCNICTAFGAYNRHALATHLRKHEADEAKARYLQRLHTQNSGPTTSNQNTNAPPSQPSDDNTSGEEDDDLSNLGDADSSHEADLDNDANDNANNEEPHNENQIPHPDDLPPSHKFVIQLKTILHNYTDEKWPEFEALVEEISEDLKTCAKIPKDPPASFTIKNTDTNDPTAMQRLYRRNRRRAMRLIQGEKSQPCNIPTDMLRDKFYGIRQNTPDLTIYDSVKKAQRPIPMNNFNKAEVKRKLMQAENTAAGPDRIAYNHWKNYDENGSVLTLMFNICLKAKNIPSAWKKSKTVMIPKSGDPNIPNNWRPIALSSTAYKLFSALMAGRMSRWLEKFQLLAKGQKGYRQFDGAIENIYTLESRIADAKRSKKSLYVFLLDLKDAFGSISHEAIYDVLHKSGAGNGFIKLKRNMNAGASTQILTPNGLSDEIPLIDGVKQGDPMSGNDFNIAANPIFDAIQDGREELFGLGFADDTSAFSNTPEDMQNTINRIVDTVNKLGLTLNIQKCKIVQFHPKRSKRHDKFYIGQDEITSLEEFQPTQYLGKPIGFNLFENRENIDEYIQSGIRIIDSKLAPWQKLDAIKTFFFPSLAYAMRTMLHTKQSWRNLDETLKPLFKKLLGLPVYAASDYLYGGSDDGLIGIPCAAWDSDVARVDTAFKLLMSTDPEIKALAFDDLARATQARCSRIPNNVDLQEFLSDREYRTTESRYTSLWSKARAASGRLGIKWHIADDHKITLLIEDKAITDKRKIFRTLRTIFKNQRTSSFRALPAQGRTQECFGANKVSNHFIRTGDYLRFCDWDFIHRARLAVVKLNGHIPNLKGDERRCRFCKFKVESIAHVLNSCDRFLSTKITDRHDRIVARLKKAASENWQVLKENQPYGKNRGLRPDLILTNKNNEALVLDVTMPFDGGLSKFNKARIKKIDKYKPVVDDLKTKYKTVSCEVIIVGPLGSWDNANDKTIHKLCSKSYAKLMKKLIVSDTIRASRDMYIEHITEREQFDYRSRFNISKRSIYPSQLLRNELNANASNNINADELSQQLSDGEIDEHFLQNHPNQTTANSQRSDTYINNIASDQTMQPSVSHANNPPIVDNNHGSPLPNSDTSNTEINVDIPDRPPQPNNIDSNPANSNVNNSINNNENSHINS